MSVDEALERVPREPNLHAKRDLGQQAREEAQTTDDELLRRLRASRPAPALSFYETEDVPARDPYVEIVPGAPAHPLNDALIVAEAAASTALETDGETKLALIRLTAEKLDETAEIERELEEPWGTHPVDTSRYGELMALPLDDRVEQLLREGARSDEDPGV